MKKSSLTLIIMLASCMAFSQGVAINEDGTAPHASAMLEVTSTEKGVLIPRMTLAQRDAIAEPASGLLIYQSDETPGFYYNAGTPATPDWQMVGSNAGTFSLWTDSGNNIYFNEGNVGIGLDNPQHQLHINLDLKAGEGRFGSIPQNILGLGPDFYGGETGLFDIDADKLIAGKDYTSGVYQYGGTPGSSEGLFINSGKVGIGIQDPTQMLDIDGLVRIRKGDPGPGKVLTSDADGVASWETPEDTSKWSETGNNIYRIEGNVGIGASEPAALLHAFETETGGGNVLFEGELKDTDPGDPPAEGAGTRMMWYPDKAAFRVGEVDGNQWNKEQIGFRSFASGFSTTASGHHSTAMGHETTASGLSSTAIGFETQATGDWSTAMGINTIASGSQSTALGVHTTAPSFAETAIGIYNTPYTPQSAVTWNDNDRLFVIGNGLDDPSNAITVLKNGNTGIGTDTPAALLHTSGTGVGQGNVLHVGEYRFLDPGPAPIEGPGTRMMWYPDKAAFRVGYVTGTQWDTENIGRFSTAWGWGTTASNGKATAWGRGTTASGMRATAWGLFTIASGEQATAWGEYTYASGTLATAWGYFTTASGSQATAWGRETTASGNRATAWGYETTASGAVATAWGRGTDASGWRATAWGEYTDAYGTTATAWGRYTDAPSLAETALGQFNTLYTPAGGTDSWNANDRLFVIGNGTSSSARSNAMTVLKSGNTGFGTDTPAALLHTSGTGQGEGNLLFEGIYKPSNPGDPPAEGSGTRMMWYPDKAAFRVGRVQGTQWDKDSIGNYSVAMGSNTKAKGDFSTAMGHITTASGIRSTAMGWETTALGNNSTAMGDSTTASGFVSTAMGSATTASGYISTAMGIYTTASGHSSTAMGQRTMAEGTSSTAMGYHTTASGSASLAMGSRTTAPSFAETVVGLNNTDYTPNSTNNWISNDRLFVIGNGTSSSARSNAMTVLKNGNIGIGTDEPEGNRLRVISSASGGGGATVNFENQNASGIALRAATNSSDGTMLVIQQGTGYNMRLDGYDPDWFVAMIVKGRQVGINTNNPGSFNLAVNGSAAKEGGGSWSNLSDARLKTINGNYTKGLNEIVALQAVNFHYIEDNPYGFDPKSAQIGFIAQEVREIFPEAVSTGDDGYLNFNMHAINVALVNAIKELKLENDKLKTENEKLRSTDEQLISRIERLEMLIASFSENQ
jgi:hypothetical protein